MTNIGVARVLIMAGVLIVVAYHAHWSVTSALTLMSIRNVIEDFNEYARGKR